MMMTPFICLDTVSAVAPDWPVGDEWLYLYVDTFEQATFEGYWRYSCVGETTYEIEGIVYDVIEYRSTLTANGSGSLYDAILSGVYIENSTEYYDVNTGSIVAFEGDYLTYLIEDFGYEKYYWNYSEHNDTEYIPPGGMGFEPYEIDVGTYWFKNYTKRSHSYGIMDGEQYDDYSNYTEQLKFTFQGYEMISVPAGTYYTSLLEIEYEDGTIARQWDSISVENFVKIVQTYESGEVISISLVDHTQFSENPSSQPSAPWWSIIFFAFIVATVGAIFVAELTFRKRRKQEMLRNTSYSSQWQEPKGPF